MKQAKIRNHQVIWDIFLFRAYNFACFFRNLMNHRESWHPEKYNRKTKATKLTYHPKKNINDEYAENLGKELGN
jgi:hypothetical protein